MTDGEWGRQGFVQGKKTLILMPAGTIKATNVRQLKTTQKKKGPRRHSRSFFTRIIRRACSDQHETDTLARASGVFVLKKNPGWVFFLHLYTAIAATLICQ